MTTTENATARVDAILAAAPDDQRTLLQSVRETIAAAVPEAEEIITYGMPGYRYHGRSLVSYSAFKAHCSFFPMSGAVIARHADELQGFATAKGTLRFTPEHPIPERVLVAMVRERMAEIDGRRATR